MYSEKEDAKNRVEEIQYILNSRDYSSKEEKKSLQQELDELRTKIGAFRG